ncbi:biotin--[acetyl-CoA-carboxylase] ligase [Vagococcus zengguangii]|nr:biotin--[acetyl-CoA-carboxylase] ligase [Vagococcus zengguangii]
MKENLLNYLMKHARQIISKQQLLTLFPENFEQSFADIQRDYYLKESESSVIFYPEVPLSVARITEQLLGAWPTLTVTWHASLSSTNTVMKEQIQTGVLSNNEPHLLITDAQTAGRGRLGRSFISDSYNGLYMSLFIPFKLTTGDLPPFTLIAAAALTQALKSLDNFDIKIKWVNDLYLNRKKVAGILTETTTDYETNQINGVIVGTGINISAFPEQIPTELRDKMGTLFEPGKETITREQLINAYLTQFSLLLNDKTKQYYPIYCDHSLILGKDISFHKDGQTITGQAVKIFEDGRLLVTLPDLSTITLLAGEISLQSY